MKRILLTLILGLLYWTQSMGQTRIPDEYYTNKHFKTTAFIEENIRNINPFQTVYITNIDTSGQTDVSEVIQNFIDSVYQVKNWHFIVQLPTGRFLIEKPIKVKDSVFLKGVSATETIINCKVGEGNACFEIKPEITNSIHSLPLNISLVKGDYQMVLPKDTLDKYLGSDFKEGYMALVSGNDSDRITSAWAKGSVKEHFWGRIDIIANQPEDRMIRFGLPNGSFYLDYLRNFTMNNRHIVKLNLNHPIEYQPRIETYQMVKEAGLGCMTINRIETVSGESPNILMQNATECVVRAVVSNDCNHAHILLKNYLHNIFKRNYLLGAKDVSEDEAANGFNVKEGSAHNCFFDNVMRELKHSVVVQSGSNNNVFISNYSYDPIRSTVPDEVWGDFVLNGNYPFGNLFESNMAEEFVFDSTNGKNGPFNIVHRNLFAGHGIIMKNENGSDSQVFSGNEMPKQSMAKFLLQDSGHFVFGNKLLTDIVPGGSNTAFEGYLIARNFDCYHNDYLSFSRRTGRYIFPCPYDNYDSNYNKLNHPPFGFPFNQPNRDILANRKKDIEPVCFDTLYDQLHYYVENVSKPMIALKVYPNPSQGSFKINLTGSLTVFDLSGKQVATFEALNENQEFYVPHKGMFILKLTRSDGVYTSRLLVH